MKTTTLNFLKMGLYAIMGLSVLLTSCSPEDGKDGIDGKDGAQGPAGQDGNANVLASEWQNIEWNLNSQQNFGVMLIEVKDIDLQEFITTGGVIMVYFKLILDESDTVVYSLPATLGNLYVDFALYDSTDTSGITITMSSSDNIVPSYANNPNYNVRYVLVPANVSEASGLNLNNYKEASKILGL